MNKTIFATAMVFISSLAQADTAPATASATTAPAQTSATPITATTATTPTTSSTPNASAAPLPTPATINCNYHTPSQQAITPDIVKMWTEKAIVQAFDYSSDNLDVKMQALKLCFTEPGWQGYNTALEQSGNLHSIKAQKLTVSSQIDGQTVVSVMKDNQWKVTLPLQVLYQNQQDKLTQLLNIDIVVTRKPSGDLGIQQIIASPRSDATAKPGV